MLKTCFSPATIRCAAFVGILLCSRAWGNDATIRIDAATAGPHVNRGMYGIFLEEINHGVDGGLYAELLRNRGFEDGRPPEGYELRNGRWLDANGFPAGVNEFGYKIGGLPFWFLVRDDAANCEMQLDTEGGISTESSYCLRLQINDVGDGRIGVANDGFFGIGLKQGEKYRLSFYARGGDEFEGPLTVRLEDAEGNAHSDTVKFNGLREDWQQFSATLTATKPEPKARLAILAGATGTVWLDFVSLFPEKTWKDRPNGLRPDIAQMIADLKPAFVRFPGGCVVEGATVETAYNWKDTIGPVEKRLERWGPWNYRRTHGMGLHEYLQFFEDLGAEPLWVGFCGQTCIFRRGRGETVPMEDMGWVRDNFLDIVDYANGPLDSPWGAKRAAAGHPAPFDLKYVEIGNENQGPELRDRYIFIHDALKAKYPSLKYIADLSFTSDDAMHGAVYDVIDRHHYQNSRWFLDRFREYDERDRSLPPLYLGEVAVTSGDAGPLRGNLRAALAEGVFLMGCERNADTVQMVSYAPLLAHVEGRTGLTGAPPPWHAMIYFDGTRVFGTASYYLWKLFGTHRPDQIVKADVELATIDPPIIAGQIGLGTWAATAEFKDVLVERDGQVLYESNFAKNADGWQPEGGRRRGRSSWSIRDSAYHQNREGYALSYFGDEAWSNYTLSLKARKLSGNEGFLIVFGREAGEQYWWNLGGWNNTQHAIELNRTPVGRPVPGRIESDRWYDIKIDLAGNRIRCYLDGELIHDVESTPLETFFVTAGRDDSSNELVVKVINTSDEPVRAKIRLEGVTGIESQAKKIVLSAATLDENNILEEPDRLVPEESAFDSASSDSEHAFAPHSLTILRMRVKRAE